MRKSILGLLFVCMCIWLCCSGLALAEDAVGEIRLKWDANTESDLAGYKVYYGVSSGEYDKVIYVGNFTNYGLKGLDINTKYYIALTALNTSGGESLYSEEVSGTGKNWGEVSKVGGVVTEIHVGGNTVNIFMGSAEVK